MTIFHFDTARDTLALRESHECELCNRQTAVVVAWWATWSPHPFYVCPICADGYWIEDTEHGYLPFGPFDTEAMAKECQTLQEISYSLVAEESQS